MATRIFLPEPVVLTASGNFPDADQPNIFPEQKIKLPWGINPVVSWLDYEASTNVTLDAGMALHKPLPQSNPAVDTLASAFVGDDDFDSNTAGVNLRSFNTQADVIQRMATSTYRFILRGYGLRVAYFVPVPGVSAVGGITLVPAERQWSAGNRLVGNFGGIPVFLNQWELHYYIARLPQSSAFVEEPIPANPAFHIRPDAELPDEIVLPWTESDQRALQQSVLRPQPP